MKTLEGTYWVKQGKMELKIKISPALLAYADKAHRMLDGPTTTGNFESLISEVITDLVKIVIKEKRIENDFIFKMETEAVRYLIDRGYFIDVK